MKLELLDAYNVRARLSASIILFAPIAITVFSCFEAVQSFSTSSALIVVLLAFTNYIPILQRRIHTKRPRSVNYAAQMLSQSDSSIDATTKARFYNKLATIDETFSSFKSPDDSNSFQKSCESAVLYLKSHTRENRLVQEEVINYGFCKNLLECKIVGVVICVLCCILVVTYSFLTFEKLSGIPTQNYFAFFTDIFISLFWLFGINKKVLESAATYYAKALILSIDALE